MIRTIIPSKDRAAQLDLLLRSMKRFFENWGDQTAIVLFRTTTDEYRSGYDTLQREHPEFVYVEEEDFRRDVKKIALAGEEGYLQFLVDDDVYVRPWSLGDSQFSDFSGDTDIAALSLRMSPAMDYCFTENVRTGTPWFRLDGAWFWPGLKGDWGYPHSVDGTIWRRCDVRAVIAHGKYDMLHQLEPALRGGMTRPLAICYGESRLLNVADNSTQDGVVANRHGGGDPEVMNRRYLAGERIQMDNIIAARPNSPHFLIEYEWAS